MQGLASPFHLRPASQMGSTKNLEVNYVPFLDQAGLQKVKDGPPQVPIPLFLFLSRSLSIWGPVTTCPLAPLLFFTSPLLDYCITNDYKTFDFKQNPLPTHLFTHPVLVIGACIWGPAPLGCPGPPYGLHCASDLCV